MIGDGYNSRGGLTMNIRRIIWRDLIRKHVVRYRAQGLEQHLSKRCGESLSNRVWYKVVGLIRWFFGA